MFVSIKPHKLYMREGGGFAGSGTGIDGMCGVGRHKLKSAAVDGHKIEVKVGSRYPKRAADQNQERGHAEDASDR